MINRAFGCHTPIKRIVLYCVISEDPDFHNKSSRKYARCRLIIGSMQCATVLRPDTAAGLRPLQRLQC